MQDKIIAAIDFGSSKISASLGLFGKDEMEILGVSSIKSYGIEKGSLKEEKKCEVAFEEVMKKVETKTKTVVSDVYVGINCRDLKTTEISKAIRVKNSKVSSYDIRKVISKAKDNIVLLDGEEIVDYIINFYKLDDKVTNNNIIGWSGEVLEVNFTMIIGKSVNLMGYRNIVRKSGYNFCGFYINILAGKNIFLQGKNLMGSRALVDIGSDTVETAIFSNGVLKKLNYRPLGGQNITKDISICGDFSVAEAEQIKKICSKNYESIYKDSSVEDILNIGSSKVSKELFYEVTKARLDELIKIVNLDLKNTSFYEGLCSIILYGDGVIYYENIKNIIKDQIDKKCTIATNNYLGMKKTENITSLAGVKEVFNKYNLLIQNLNTENNDKSYRFNSKMQNKKEEISDFNIEREILRGKVKEEEENSNGILKKLKRLLKEIF